MSLSTTDYGQFNKYESNRVIIESHVYNLMKKIQAENLLEADPIIVNEELYVIDGQHRLEACKRLSIPAVYRIVPGLKEPHISALNTTKKNWQPADYLNYYVSMGNIEYKKLFTFVKAYSLNLSEALAVGGFTAGGTDMQKFKDGRFVFSMDGCEYQERVEQILDIIEYIKEKSIEKVSFLHSKTFWAAASMFLGLPDVCFDTFMEKLALRVHVFHPAGSKKAFFEAFKHVYNFKSRKPLKVSYDEFVAA